MEAVGALGSNVSWYLWQSVQETGVMLTSWGETKRNQEKEGQGVQDSFFILCPLVLFEF